MTTQQIFARASTRLRLVWAALTFAYLLFAGVMLAASHAQSRPLDVGTEGAFIVMAAVVAVFSFVMPARFYAARVRTIRPDIAVGGGGAAGFLDPPKAAAQALQAFAASFLVGVALSCSLSWLGAFLHVMGASMTLCSAFFVAAIVLSALRFPSARRIATPFERHFGASFAASEGGSY